MKHIVYLILPFLLLLLYGGCSDNGTNNNMDCFPNEDFATAECLAEAVLTSCERLSCGSSNSVTSPVIPNCEAIDCTTFECQEVQFIIGGMATIGPGTFTDLELDEFGVPIGLIEVNGVIEEFDCVLVVP